MISAEEVDANYVELSAWIARLAGPEASSWWARLAHLFGVRSPTKPKQGEIT